MPEIDPAALAGWSAHHPVVERSGATMGTRWRVLFASPAGCDVDRVAAAIERRLDHLVSQMSHWMTGSLISAFNQSTIGQWMTLPVEFATVIAAALDVAAASDGGFDPALGELVDLWGYGPRPVASPPAPDAVAAALWRGGWRQLRFDPAARRLQRLAPVRLDLSGIAKGYAVDCLSDMLAAHGIGHSLVEIGGEFVGRGMRPDGDPWWVELETPGALVRPLRLALHQCAVATSGDYVRGRHTIDPRNGRPVAHTLSVSVVHRSAMLADAWATALGVSDLAGMKALAVANDLALRALIRQRGTVVEWLSPALSRMLVDDAAGPEHGGAGSR